MPRNHDLAHVSPRRIFFTWAEAKLFGVHQEDIQTLVCPDESADECAIVVCNYSKSTAKDALQVPDCFGVSHQDFPVLYYKSVLQSRPPTRDRERHGN